MYRTIQKFGVHKIFNVFKRLFLCPPVLLLFDQKYSKTVIWNIITILK